MIDGAMRFINMMNSAIPQAPCGGVVFFPRNVIARLIQQFHCAAITSGAIHSCIDRRMIVQPLAVVDGRSFNLIDGFVNFVDSAFFFFVHVIGRGRVFEVGAGMPQIGKGMEICRMSSGFIG